jgi:L-ascorbate metabolism protein UlaG (beta-lactamase superfamily)
MNLKHIIVLLLLLLLFAAPAKAQKPFDYTLKTADGDVLIHVLGHASVLFEWKGLAIYADPYAKAYSNFSSSPKADLILITHADADHFDATAINLLKKETTLMVYTKTCSETKPFIGTDTLMANGDSLNLMGLSVKAVPAYNIVKTRHVKGIGNAYIIDFADKRVYLSGDGELIPEMADFDAIDLSFMGYSQPYNMTTAMFTEATKVIGAPVVIPYHYDYNDISELTDAFQLLPEFTLLTKAIETSGLTRLPQNLRFYPNLTHDRLYSEAFKPNSNITVYHSSGEKVFCKLNVDGFIAVDHLSPGLYFISIDGQAGKFLVY